MTPETLQLRKKLAALIEDGVLVRQKGHDNEVFVQLYLPKGKQVEEACETYEAYYKAIHGEIPNTQYMLEGSGDLEELVDSGVSCFQINGIAGLKASAAPDEFFKEFRPFVREVFEMDMSKLEDVPPEDQNKYPHWQRYVQDLNTIDSLRLHRSPFSRN